MPNHTLWNEAQVLWLVFTLYFLTQYRSIQVKRDGGFRNLSLDRLAMLPAVLLTFFPATHISVLATPIVHSHSIALAGLCLTVAGLAFAAWARDVLGRNWSGRIVVQRGHQLVTAGPYSYLRHPLYTGMLIAMAGTALISGQLGAAIGFACGVLFLSAKARREERILEEEFGPGYADYRSRTGRLLPRIAHV